MLRPKIYFFYLFEHKQTKAKAIDKFVGMLRKNIRLRREYIYNMESEKRNKKKFEQKMQIKNAIMGNSVHPSRPALNIFFPHGFPT